MFRTAVMTLMGSTLVFAQAVTSSTDQRESSVTTQKLDGSRTKTVTHRSASRHTADSNGNSTSNSSEGTTVTKDKGGKKTQSTTSTSENSTVHP